MRPLSAVEKRFAEENRIPLEALAAPPRGEKIGISDGGKFSPQNLVAPQLDAIQIIGKERFGNSVHRLVNALGLARALDIRLVIIPQWEFLEDEFAVEGVRFTKAEPQPYSRILWGSFEKSTLIHHLIGPVDVRRTISDLTAGFAFDTRPPPRGNESLTIHIRSGDVFEGNHAKHYGQPPLAFYQRVFDEEDWRHVCVVFQNLSNPVITPLLKWLDSRGIILEIIDRDVRPALEELWRARNLVASNGSFLEAALASSANLEKIYVFGQRSARKLSLLGGPLETREYRDYFGLYEREVMLAWRDARWQRNLMMLMPKWTIISIE